MTDAATAQTTTDAGDVQQTTDTQTANTTVLGGDGETGQQTQTQTQTDGKQTTPTDDKGAPADKDKGDGGDDAGEPVPFDAGKLELPEGFKLEGETLEAFTTLVNDYKLDQKGAQALVNQHTTTVQKAIDATLEQVEAQKQEIRDKWRTEVSQDAELKKPEHHKLAASFIERFGGTAESKAALREALNETGMGNNPHLLRLMLNAARAMGEDNPTDVAAAGTGQQLSIEERMYGKKS